MMAVGDRDGLRLGDRDQLADVVGISTVGLDDPQSVTDSIVVTDLDRGLRVREPRENRGGPAMVILVQPDDRARVHAGRPEEPIAVLARTGEGPLVGQDARALGEWLEPKT